MGALCWTRAEFLDATFWDIYAAYEGYANHMTLLLKIPPNKKRGIPLTRPELEEMMRRFPDKKRA